MKAKLLLLTTVLSWNLTAVAQSKEGSFTMVGVDSHLGKECYLYVDSYGYDLSRPNGYQFFAKVRTSFNPEKVKTATSNPRIPSMMGSPGEIKVHLPAQADEESLLQATSYEAAFKYDVNGRPAHSITCKDLRSAN